MQLARPVPEVIRHRRARASGARAAHRDPRRFGRCERVQSAAAEHAPNSDLRLFGTTFLAGFVFVSLLIA